MCVRSAGLTAVCTHLHPLRFSSTAVLLLQVSSGFWLLQDASLVWIRTKCPGCCLWLLTPRDFLAKSVAPNVPFPPTKTHTQEVTERWVQHPEEQQELPKLSLHGLLTLLKVPMLWGEGHVKGWTPTPGRGPVSRPCSEPHHELHEATETPEGIHLILNDVEDWRQEVTHALDVA